MNRREKQKAETLAELLKAAEELFIEQGYEKTSINQIVKKCEITKGAFYHHFKSKEEILERMCDNHYQLILKAIEPILANPTLPPFKKIKEIINTSRTLGLERSDFIGEYFQAKHDISNLILKERLKRYDKKMYVQVIAPLLGEARERGECNFYTTPQVIAIFLFQLDQSVTEEINEIMRKNSSHPQDEIAAVIGGFAYSVKSLLKLDDETVEDILNPQQAILFFTETLRNRRKT